MLYMHIYITAWYFLSPGLMCNVISDLSRGQSECVRSVQVTTHTVKNLLLRKHQLVMSAPVTVYLPQTLPICKYALSDHITAQSQRSKPGCCRGERVGIGQLIYLVYLPLFMGQNRFSACHPDQWCPVVAAFGFTGSPPPQALILSLIWLAGATLAG